MAIAPNLEAISMDAKQLGRWAGEFGKSYTLRNLEYNFHPERLDTMRSLFGDALQATTGNVRRVLEVGCNTGHNFLAMAPFGFVEMVGIDPQVSALRIGKERGVPASLLLGSGSHIPFLGCHFDLVMTNGVLMHVSPTDLTRTLAEIDRVSCRYFFTMDYFDEIETAVRDYHGYDDMLWRRDMRASVARAMPNWQVLWERRVSQDQDTGRSTWAFLFEKQTSPLPLNVRHQDEQNTLCTP